KGTTAQLDARPGGLYRVLMPSGDRVRGKYVAPEPPHRVVFTWGFEGSIDLPPGASTVDPGARLELGAVSRACGAWPRPGAPPRSPYHGAPTSAGPRNRPGRRCRRTPSPASADR